MPEQPDWKPLVQVLHSDTGEARAHAIPVLARYFNSSAQVRLEAAHLLATETHPRTRNALVDALRAEVSDKVVRDALIERVQRDSDPGVQRSAIQALSELLADAAVLDALIGATNDGDPSVRYEAAQALQAMSQDDRVGAVLEPLLRDDDPNVRAAAVDSIYSAVEFESVAQNAAVLHLIPDPDARAEAAMILARLRAAILRVEDLGVSEEQRAIINGEILPRVQLLDALVGSDARSDDHLETQRRQSMSELARVSTYTTMIAAGVSATGQMDEAVTNLGTATGGLLRIVGLIVAHWPVG